MNRYSRRQIVGWVAALGTAPLLTSADADYEDAEAYRVYSALIPQDWVWQVAKAESLVIAANTVSSVMCLKPEGESAKLLAPAIEKYKELTDQRWHLQRRFELARPYTLIYQAELNTYFSKGGSGWKGFYERYPKSGGYLFLSPVGFNASKDIAVVQVNHSCGGLCGGGSFSVMQKKDDVWSPLRWEGEFCAWAS